MGVVKAAWSKTYKFIRGVHRAYYEALQEPIWRQACLFEAGQGKNVNGNMIALIRELAWNPDFEGFQIYCSYERGKGARLREKLERYGIEAEYVRRGSARYDEAIARCEYLFTDNSFPTFFEKRPEQIYVNTWHGTPLKRLGHSNIRNSIVSISNIQKNMLSADYMLFPNELTRYCFFTDYKLEPLFSNHYFMADYPRNDALSDPAIREVVREREGLEGKRVTAYMPTWRGSSRSADTLKQTENLYTLLTELDGLLGDDDLLYVNLHFLINNALDYEEFTHIRQFPSDYETYDFLSACDQLITDYSSVFFDFAVTRRKIILYPYDRDEYLETVGTYLPYEDLPFPVAMTPRELADLIAADSYEPYDEFNDTYCRYHTGHAGRDLLETVCLGKPSLELYENDKSHPVSIVYVDRFTRPAVNELLMSEIERDWPEDRLLVFMGGSYGRTATFLEDFPDDIPYLSITTYRHLPRLLRIEHGFARRSTLVARIFKKKLVEAYAHERERLMPTVKAKSVVLFAPRNEHFTTTLGSFKCKKVAYVRSVEHLRARQRRRLRSMVVLGDYEVQDPPVLDPELYSEEAKERFYNEYIEADLLVRLCENTSDATVLKGVLSLRCLPEAEPEDISIELADGLKIGEVKPFVTIGSLRFMFYKIIVPMSEAANLPTQSAVMVRYYAKDGLSGSAHLDYMPVNLHLSPRKRTQPFLDKERNTSLFFRHSGKNYLYVTIRQTNPSDSPEGRRLLNQGYWLAKVRPERKAVVLFEKLSSRYEESASVVYERLIDEGYENVYFILDDDYAYRDQIPEKYRANIVSKNSLEHYRLFFSAHTFIGSEMLAHCIELGSSSDHVAERLADPNINYVFLQHGVMYMVSLDSASRALFRPRRSKRGKYRVVTSSELEKLHFVERARYRRSMVYVCGLPKFDRNKWNEDADRIVIMPTWRPWETNAARIDFRDTDYYRFIERIMDSIPPELLDKVVILAHPLFQQHIIDVDFPLKRYMDVESRYDDILQNTKLLVTDYSSIAYDAFYRGANVVFYWSDKDDCMEHYGSRTTLMIDDDTAFGTVCYTTDELEQAIKDDYARPQAFEHMRRYDQIVEFHDGKNTDRLVEMLREDKIIPRRRLHFLLVRCSDFIDEKFGRGQGVPACASQQ